MNIYADLWTQARALVILKIIFDLGRPAQLRELVAITQGDDETISKYCSFLATRGLLTRTTSHMGWNLTAQGFSFLRPSVETQDVASLSTGPVDNSPEIPVNSPESVLSTTTINSHDEEELVIVETGKTGFFSGNLALFEEIGITLNPQTDFIARNIDPTVTRVEWQKLLDKGKPWPGLLIKILTHPPHPKSKAQTDADLRARYGQWDQDRIS